MSRVDVAENLDASERAVHIEYRDRGAVATLVERARSTPGLTGVSAWSPGSDGSVASGVPWVRDPLSALMQGAVVEGWLRRHPAAFFQGNRFLLGALVSEVTGRTDGDVLDLYAGVGLFGVVLAAASTTRRVVAVEEDRAAARDLAANAAPFGDRMRVHEASAEAVLSGSLRDRPETIIVDPPRVGLSRTVTERLAAARAPRIVYVACDAATFARDARRLIEAGYEMSAVRPFDLFPTTAHVECVTSFTRT